MTGFYRGVNSWHNTEKVWSQGWESQYNFSICCTCLFLCFVDFHNNFILYSSGNSTKEKWSASHCTCEWKRSEKTASHENVYLRRGSLYLCFIPVIIIALLLGKALERSCLLLRVWPLPGVMINLSSTANPAICFIFVENYRRGLREFCGSFLIKCSKRRHHIDNGPKGITLQSIRVLQNSNSN